MFCQPFDPYSRIYRGIKGQNQRKNVNPQKSIYLYSFIYHFKANFMLSLNMVLFFMFRQPLHSYSGVNRLTIPRGISRNKGQFLSRNKGSFDLI
jgi:hypothetical protein